MKTVAIPNIDVKVWNLKNEFPQGIYPRSLIQPGITRQRNFGLMQIEYDITKYET